MKTADHWMKLWAKQLDGPTPLATTVKTANLQIALDDARAEGLSEAFKDKQRMDKLQEWADKFIVEFCAYSDKKIDLVAKELPDGRTESLRIAWSVSAAKNLREAIDQISEWQTRRVGLKDNEA